MNPFENSTEELVRHIDSHLRLDVDLATTVLTGFVANEVEKVGFSRSVVALLGGIDSALSLAISARALGPSNVLAVMMPYRTSNPASQGDAEELIAELGVHSKVIDITPIADPYLERYDLGNVRRGNVMARVRMTVLYDQSEEFHGLVIGTSNKTELLLGYGTIHGDIASAINPLGDLFKTQVRQIAHTLDLPRAIIEKVPSADLWEGQQDEEELGFTYDDLDRLLYLLIDERWLPTEIIGAGIDPAFVDKILLRVRRNQFKRRPSVIAKISERTIEREFRYPRDWGI